MEVLKAIACRGDLVLLSVRVYDGGHVYVFVSAKLKVCISDVVCVLKCNSVRVLFLVSGVKVAFLGWSFVV